MSQTYIKQDNVVLLDNCNRFIYEVLIEVSYDNITCVVKHEYFSTNSEIKEVVEFYKYSSNINIYCILFSAPKKWLEDNNYCIYTKPIKKKSIK